MAETPEFRPHFLDSRDQVWVSALADEYQRFVGKSTREWRRRLQEPLPYYCPRSKLRFAVKALDEVFQKVCPFPKKKIVELRSRLFHRSESVAWPTDAVEIDAAVQKRRTEVAGEFATEVLGSAFMPPATFDGVLFADLPSERLIVEPKDDPNIASVMLTANTLLLKSILRRSHRVEILIRGNVRPVVRQAHLRGLICEVEDLPGNLEFECKLVLTGPLAIFRNAPLYGRLLLEILPFLPNCDRFRLTATVIQGEATQAWVIVSGDPIESAPLGTGFDSKIERQFAKDFRNAAPDFDLIREPQPVTAGRHLIFPDFALKHRTDERRSWLVEIVGYWTTTYLEKKAADLRAANLCNLILCVDRRFGGADRWPPDARIVPFDRRIKAKDVLEAMLGPENRHA